jgi:hypothetical protein
MSYSQDYLKMANLMPDSGREVRAAAAEDRRLTKTELNRQSTSVLGMYRNFAVPAEASPMLSPLHPTDAVVSTADGSYNISQFPAKMRAVPNAERLSLTHADIHCGVNR